ncbi:DUF998 domain-containing protein [Solirubrobacter phytolaccae]|uniref:DUF998 domain-containing protein n=1 Tax=Solirubrobacter phytolaccae TaxID=1404360 RepID=A0A9X3NAU1_9ACTN|nr:DUF998 domain-containing protein [Solirubrobacter phytolaccae]MDA0179292.1 DUF998 domain-containing protein [Solirubrobacter phytolaccae]
MRLATSAQMLLGGFVAVVALQHALVPELAPQRNMVSEYANAPFGWLMVCGFSAWALSFALTAALLRRDDPVLGTLFAGMCVGALLVAVFPTETIAGVLPAGVPRTAEGRLHDAGSGLITLALLAAVLIVAARPSTPACWRAWSLGLAMLAVSVNVILLAVGPSVGGLRQRALIVIGCLWHASLLRRARAQKLVG